MSKRIASRRRAFSQVISSSLSSSRTSSSYFLIVWIVSACLITRSIAITAVNIIPTKIRVPRIVDVPLRHEVSVISVVTPPGIRRYI
ncbi:hypothetical protein ES703_45522 [subsurface metagenome]